MSRTMLLAVTPEAIGMAAIDVVAATERVVRRKLDSPRVSIRWVAECWSIAGPAAPMELVDWTPGTPLPDRTHLLKCVGRAPALALHHLSTTGHDQQHGQKPHSP